ncbi:hypothetical protein CFOL_v3_30059 [Cephalotus follicularis]|uniref:Uncharacterized protein n=1 Tax=Cephalotus follicularis TaxID=3775 RepID=A0A1Q3D2G8_CEPFO|nr:hypothetical protein CFOL_v3_30059 [Cephalotus follicularis]
MGFICIMAENVTSESGPPTGAIAGGVAAGAALLFAAPAIGFAYWRRRKPRELFLPGDGLTEKWEEWQKAEEVRHQLELTPPICSEWIVDSTKNIHAIGLSGPR